MKQWKDAQERQSSVVELYIQRHASAKREESEKEGE